MLSEGLFLPAVTIGFLGWLVPKLLSRVLPEGVKPLMVNACLSAMILFCISAAFFVLLYVYQGLPWAEVRSFGIVQNVLFFGKLGGISALIWAPIMVLTVANLPRSWVRAVW